MFMITSECLLIVIPLPRPIYPKLSINFQDHFAHNISPVDRNTNEKSNEVKIKYFLIEKYTNLCC